jgi:hypothetical protein
MSQLAPPLLQEKSDLTVDAQREYVSGHAADRYRILSFAGQGRSLVIGQK